MCTNSELNLYDHVDFFDSIQISRPSSGKTPTKSKKSPHRKHPYKANNKQKYIGHNTDQKIGNYTKEPNINNENSHQKLDPFELMFFPSNYDPSPSFPQQLTADDFNRKQNYLNKIKKMSNADKRKHRAERDLRYLHKNAERQTNEQKEDEFDEESNLFCVHHLTGRCNKTTCKRVHQLREPRLFGVCKYFLSKSCLQGDSCRYMHSEFPCRYYYLDLEHPKKSNKDECPFNHGGPLNKEMNQYFKKHIEFWVKETTSEKPDDFEKKLNDFIGRFDLKQMKLEEENNQVKKKTIQFPKRSAKFTWESCFYGDVFEKLAKVGIDSFEKINNAPVDLLLKCGLNMDQIYEITIRTCEGTRSPIQETSESDDETFDFVHSSDVDSDTHSGNVTSKMQEATMPKDSYGNMPGLDEKSENDANQPQSEYDSFQDIFAEDFELSDDSDPDNLVINELK